LADEVQDTDDFDALYDNLHREDAEEDGLASDELDFEFDAGLIAEKEGDAIFLALGQKMNNGLCAPSDRAKISRNRPKIPSTSQRSVSPDPKLNQEFRTLDTAITRREKRFYHIQDQLTCSLTIVSRLMSDIMEGQAQKQPVDSKQQFSQLSDAARLLMSAHKDMSQARRESLRPGLSRDFQILCNAQLNETLDSNEFLFGEDINKKAEEALKTKRLTSKFTPTKNLSWRGRTYHRQCHMHSICKYRSKSYPPSAQ